MADGAVGRKHCICNKKQTATAGAERRATGWNRDNAGAGIAPVDAMSGMSIQGGNFAEEESWD
jgi:hypothetical protein